MCITSAIVSSMGRINEKLRVTVLYYIRGKLFDYWSESYGSRINSVNRNLKFTFSHNVVGTYCIVRTLHKQS